LQAPCRAVDKGVAAASTATSPGTAVCALLPQPTPRPPNGECTGSAAVVGWMGWRRSGCRRGCDEGCGGWLGEGGRCQGVGGRIGSALGIWSARVRGPLRSGAPRAVAIWAGARRHRPSTLGGAPRGPLSPLWPRPNQFPTTEAGPTKRGDNEEDSTSPELRERHRDAGSGARTRRCRICGDQDRPQADQAQRRPWLPHQERSCGRQQLGNASRGNSSQPNPQCDRGLPEGLPGDQRRRRQRCATYFLGGGGDTPGG
jgi:hypothetical protein